MKKKNVQPPAVSTTTDDARLDAVINMMGNAAALMTASLSSAMGDAMGGAFAAMGEAMGDAMGAAFGDDGSAKKQVKKAGKKVAQDMSAQMQKMVTETLGPIRESMREAVTSLTPEQKKELMVDIQQESYEKALSAVAKADFGLPKLTEPLSVDDLVRYLQLQDPRLGELLQQVLSVPPPKVFGQDQPVEAPVEEKAPEPPAKTVPKTIKKLPATYLFLPGQEAAIIIQSQEPLWIKWSSTLDEGNKCQHCGIEIQDNNSQMAMLDGGTLCEPEKGKICVTIKNREDFPITVAILTEPERTQE